MIGVVGLGVVGGATKQLFESFELPVLSYDIRGVGNCSSIRELAEKASVTFVCVPTPTGTANNLDTRIVADVCQQLKDHADGSHVTVVRSTVPIGTCKTLPGAVVYNPEFCNARSAFADMRDAQRVVLGGPLGLVQRVRTVYDGAAHGYGRQWAYALTSWEEAEALKLVTNAAMAVKITFANEAAVLCERLGAKWEEVSRLLALDPRLGSVGWQVPGPDGKYGFGGACLPKDLAGLVAQQTTHSTPSEVTEAAHRANKRIRAAVEYWRSLIAAVSPAEGKP